jgi:hypothetical protein
LYKNRRRQNPIHLRLLLIHLKSKPPAKNALNLFIGIIISVQIPVPIGMLAGPKGMPSSGSRTAPPDPMPNHCHNQPFFDWPSIYLAHKTSVGLAQTDSEIFHCY